MMTYSDDHIVLAAEYALGTLDADERALVDTMMIVDRGFVDLIDMWNRKLAPLHQMVGEVEPPEHVWQNIKAATGTAGAQMPIRLPDMSPVARSAVDADVSVTSYQDHDVRPSDSMVGAPGRASSRILDFQAQREKKSGRAFGAVMTALAASLAGIVALQAYRPELLPDRLRVKPAVQLVEVKAPAVAGSAQMVALLQGASSSPAFILTVDTASKNFTVRKVGAAPESGKSFELWLVSDKLPKPRSLGVIGNSDFTIRPTLASYDNDTINKATYAVTVEPEGGSTSGAPTGPIVFKGNLIESVPAGADTVAPRR